MHPRPPPIPISNVMVNVRCPVVAEPIECKAAVSWGPKEKLVIETITVAPPKSNEVRVKLTATGVCHTDWFTMYVVCASLPIGMHSHIVRIGTGMIRRGSFRASLGTRALESLNRLEKV